MTRGLWAAAAHSVHQGSSAAAQRPPRRSKDKVNLPGLHVPKRSCSSKSPLYVKLSLGDLFNRPIVTVLQGCGRCSLFVQVTSHFSLLRAHIQLCAGLYTANSVPRRRLELPARMLLDVIFLPIVSQLASISLISIQSSFSSGFFRDVNESTAYSSTAGNIRIPVRPTVHSTTFHMPVLVAQWPRGAETTVCTTSQ